MSSKITYIAISSNSRELYKADIYRVLAKPNNSIEHFRYQKKWIETTTSDDPITKEKLLNQEVIIVFKDAEKSEYIPIRKAIIKDFEFDTDSEIYHYYFELLDFCEIDNISTIPFNNNKFFYKFDNITSKKVIWKTIIEKIKVYFPDKVFYKIDKLITNSKKNVSLQYNSTNHSYTYPLVQGNEYSLILSIANPNEAKSNITIKSSTSDVNIILSEDYGITVPYDKIKIPITTKNLDSFKEKSYISFYIKNEDKESYNEYENHIHIEKKVNYSRPFLFGLLSTILIVLTWLIKDNTSQIENLGCWECTLSCSTMFYILLIFLTSSLLLAIYNKK